MSTSPLTLRDVTALLRLTLTDPAAAARAILALGIARQHHWTLFLLAITLSGLLWQLNLVLLPPEQLAEVAAEAHDGAGAPVLPSGFTFAAIAGASILLLAAAIRWIGRLAGGSGGMQDVLLLSIWFQFLQLALAVVDLVLVLIAPVLGTVFSLVALGVAMWVLTNFVAVVHGFRSLGRVFLGMVLATFALAFLLSLLITPFLGAPAGA